MLGRRPDAARLLAVAFFLFSISIAGCGVVRTAGGGPLPTVSPLPSPHPPKLIAQFGPTGEVDTLAQIRVHFSRPLIPIEKIESADVQAKLNYFSIDPPLAGHFRFLTPRLVGFQADAALPIATRIRVAVKAGLDDVRGDKIEPGLAWTFNTTPLEIKTYETSDPVVLNPVLRFSSNAELDRASLDRTVSILIGKTSVPVKIALEKSVVPDRAQDALTRFDPSLRDWTYDVVPVHPLAKAMVYELVIGAGLMPAHGNLPTGSPTLANYSTYSPLSFELSTRGQAGRFAQGDPQLIFNNGLIADSASANISISPSPKPWANLVQTYDGAKEIYLDAAAFEPATPYTITIGAGLTDVFGQKLGKAVAKRFNPGDLTPNFWAPRGLSIFPAGVDLQLVMTAVNLPGSSYKAAYHVVAPQELVRNDPSLWYRQDENTLLAGTEWKARSLHAKLNQPVDITVPLRDMLGGDTGMLAYGATPTAALPSEIGSFFFGAVQLTNLGVFAQWFPDSGLVRVHHLSDGSPVSGARVEIYRSLLSSKSRLPDSPCATATTDAAGSAVLGPRLLRECFDTLTAFAQPPQLLAIAREGRDWSYARSYEWSGAYGFGIYSGWDDGKPQSRGTIYSDRNLYQQGEDAWFTGAAYYLQNGVLHRDAGTRYRLTLEDPQGKKTDLGWVTPDAFGAFSRKLTFGKTQALGYYGIHAKSEAGMVIDGQFRVAQFRPPNFKVDLKLDKDFAVAGDVVNASSQSNYLFGSPVQGGTAKFYATRAQTSFTPKGRNDFTFGRQWSWPEQPPSVGTDVLQATAVLGTDGSATQRVDVARDIPFAMSYEVDVETTDVSNLSVATSKTFTALPSSQLIGVQCDWVGTSGQALPVKIIVTDPLGTALHGRRVHVELQRMTYDSVDQVIEGGVSTLNQVEYKAAAVTDVISDGVAVQASVVPPTAGSYRIRANFANAKSDATATDSFVWATGNDPVFWNSENPSQLQVKLDKPSYRPGEIATALIQSPYPQGELYFAVIRRDTLYRVTEKVHGGAPEVHFRVTSDMLPNAAVEAVLVRTGAPLSQTRASGVDSLSRVGFAPFGVKLDGKYLKVSIAPRAASVEPGQRQTLHLTLRDAQGRPAQGELAVAVANEAVLQLSSYRLPDLVSVVYADQDIMTRFADNRPNVVLHQPPSPIDKGWGFGGGLSEGAAGTRVRTNFQPLAYFNGAVRTDAQGRADIAFSVPDDLTTWRVMAVATGSLPGSAGDFRFGKGDATFVTTKPLVTNPLLPQFARPGDAFMAGVAVTNASGLKGNLDIRGKLDGMVRFNESGGRSSTTSVEATLTPATQAFRFPVIAGAAGDARVRFDTSGGGAGDAFAVSIPVVLDAYLEQVVESGVTDDRVVVPINVDAQVRRDSGGLAVSIASTLLPEITEPARGILDTDCMPLLEPASTQLMIAADVITIGRKYGRVTTVFSPARVAAADLDALAKLQQPDGGFAWWPGARFSAPNESAYAAQSIGAARDAGIPVDVELIARLKSYLSGVLANPGDISCTEMCPIERRLDALLGLSALGDTSGDFLQSIYSARDGLNYTRRLQLARYLLRFASWRYEGHAMAVRAAASAYETGRSATVNVQREWSSWYDSLAIEQAEALQLMIADGANAEFIDRMVQGLLALRRQGTWRYPYEDARALGALIDYGAVTPVPPNFSATARLGSREIGAAHFTGYANPSRRFDLPMTSLPAGRSDLDLAKSGAGTLHYFVEFSYLLKGVQPGIIQGLRVLRYVRRANDNTVLWQSGLAPPTAPLGLGVGQVFDVELEVIADHPVDNVVITDPLPAGFEAVDTSFRTSTQYYQALTDSWQLDYQAIYRDRVVAYGDHLDAGDYSFHYLVRSVTPGTFFWPGAQAQLQYAPETFGRTASATLELRP